MFKYYKYDTKEFMFESKRDSLNWCVVADGVIKSKCEDINSAARSMAKLEKNGFKDVKLVHIANDI